MVIQAPKAVQSWPQALKRPNGFVQMIRKKQLGQGPL